MDQPRARIARRVLASMLVTLACAIPAAAQTPPAQTSARPGDGTWELVIRGGYEAADLAGGHGAVPDNSATLPTMSAATTTQAVSSWLFGDGASLFNAAIGPRAPTPPISPLDSALTSPGATHRGPVVGFDLVRHLNDRVALQFGLDLTTSVLSVSGSASAAIEAARSSFVNGFNATLQDFGTSHDVSAVATPQSGSGRQAFITGAIRIALGRPRGFSPYVTVGGGVATGGGTGPSESIVGHYAFTAVTRPAGSATEVLTPFDETDSVTVRYSDGGTTPVAVVALGVDHHVSARAGIRVEGRVYLGPSRATTSVDATPSHQTLSPAGATSFSQGTVSVLQFSSEPQFQSSLSGPALSNVETFTGAGLRTYAMASFEYYFRF